MSLWATADTLICLRLRHRSFDKLSSNEKIKRFAAEHRRRTTLSIDEDAVSREIRFFGYFWGDLTMRRKCVMLNNTTSATAKANDGQNLMSFTPIAFRSEIKQIITIYFPLARKCWNSVFDFCLNLANDQPTNQTKCKHIIISVEWHNV